MGKALPTIPTISLLGVLIGSDHKKSSHDMMFGYRGRKYDVPPVECTVRPASLCVDNGHM